MSYERFFRNSSIEEKTFFDEGPRIPETKVRILTGSAIVNTSSIDTAPIDAYRQGVELTQQKHYDAGIVKIHAGEPGHVLSQNRFGMSKNFRPEPFFEELDLFEPVEFIEAQQKDSYLTSGIITFPIVTGDNDQIENYWLNGIIEVFPIREVISLFSIEVPFQSRTVRGEFMSGNEDQHRSSDVVISIKTFDPTEQQIPYLDMVNMVDGQLSTQAYFQNEKVRIKPFVDERLVLNTMENLIDSEIKAAVSLMTGSSGNYVEYNQQASTAGWVYDNNVSVGTDSIAFGGFLY